MTYLELVRGLRGRVLMQGSGPSSISSAAGAEQDLVNAVYDAWLDIQNYERPGTRGGWKWMRDQETFSTVAGTGTYELSDIFTGSYRFRRWLPLTCYALIGSEYQQLKWYTDYDEFRHLTINQGNNVPPFRFSIKGSDIVMDKPDDVYTITIDYQKSPQLLSADTDEPEMPEAFHMVIIYKAVEKYAAAVGSPELFQLYSQDYAVQWGNLCRNQLSPYKVKMRGIA